MFFPVKFVDVFVSKESYVQRMDPPGRVSEVPLDISRRTRAYVNIVGDILKSVEWT